MRASGFALLPQDSVSDLETPILEDDLLDNGEVLVNLLSMFIGIGVLDIPAKVQENGIIGAMFFTVLATVATGCSAYLLGKTTARARSVAKESGQPIVSMEDVATLAFGKLGGLVCNILGKLILFGILLLYANLITRMSDLCLSLSNYFGWGFEGGWGWFLLRSEFWLLLFTAFPMSILIGQKSVKKIAVLSQVGLVATGGIVLTPYLACLYRLVYPGEEAAPVTSVAVDEGKIKGIIDLMNTMVLSFFYNSIVPDQVLHMKKPGDFGRIVAYSQGIGLALYGSLGLLAYWAFGAALTGTDLVRLFNDLSNGDAVLMGVLLVITFSAVVKGIFSCVFIDINLGDNVGLYLNKSKNHTITLAIRGSILFTGFLLTVVPPLSDKEAFQNLIGYIGSFGMVPLQVWLPAAMYLCIKRQYPKAFAGESSYLFYMAVFLLVVGAPCTLWSCIVTPVNSLYSLVVSKP